MLPLYIPRPPDRPLRLLTLGAHPDDIEIACGGTLLTFAEVDPTLEIRYVVMTGSRPRHEEARKAAADFLAGLELTVELHNLDEGRLPMQWLDVKEVLEDVAREFTPDIIFAPSREDAHQDHRTIAEIVPTVFRDSLYLAYEIPKWDGDIWRPSLYVPLAESIVRRKVDLLFECYQSQQTRDWWDEEVFLGIARVRGMECRARYAEAFGCSKSTLTLSPSGTPAAPDAMDIR